MTREQICNLAIGDIVTVDVHRGGVLRHDGDSIEIKWTDGMVTWWGYQNHKHLDKVVVSPAIESLKRIIVNLQAMIDKMERE